MHPNATSRIARVKRLHYLEAHCYAKRWNHVIIRPMLYYVLLTAAIVGFVFPLVAWPRLPVPGKIVHAVLEFALLGAVIVYYPGH